MFNTIKKVTKLIAIFLVLLTFIITDIVIHYSIKGEFGFIIDFSVIILLVVLLLIALFIAALYNKSLITPIKKLERSMKNLKEGKNVDSRQLSNSTNLGEMQSLIGEYSEVLNSLLKNRFELNSQESKTAIILERMDDGVIAFSMQKQIIHINGAAKRFADLTDAEDTYEKVMKKLKLKIDFDKVLYLSNYKNIEEKATVNDNV
jgi:two-component system sensor histidine kinase VicK